MERTGLGPDRDRNGAEWTGTRAERNRSGPERSGIGADRNRDRNRTGTGLTGTERTGTGTERTGPEAVASRGEAPQLRVSIRGGTLRVSSKFFVAPFGVCLFKTELPEKRRLRRQAAAAALGAT